MPSGGLYGRVASRGFPSSAAAGQTGAGALESQGGTADPRHGQDVTAAGQFTTLPGFQPETVPAPDLVILDGAWGLSGTVQDPDQTPGYGPGTFRSHAAPAPGWAGSYTDADALATVRDNSTEIHSADFGALARRGHSPSSSPEPQLDIWTSNDPGASVQQPIRGQLQAMGGRDAVQGYDRRNSYGFDAGHRKRTTALDPQPMAYLDSAERVFIVPQASGTFAPTDAVQGPQPVGTFLDAGNVNATPASSYSPPPAPDQQPAGPPAGAPASAGWWS